MVIDLGDIPLEGSYKILIGFILYVVVLISSIIVYFLSKKDAITLKRIKLKISQVINITSTIIFILSFLGVLMLRYFITMQVPELLLVIDKPTNSINQRIIYFNDIKGGNGYRIFDDDNRVYHFADEANTDLRDYIYELEGEYCEIEYYSRSKVIKSILVIEDINKLGRELTKPEIETFNIPVYPGDDATKAPGKHWLWKDWPDLAGEPDGYWEERFTKEKLNPDINFEQPNGPHWDYTNTEGKRYRIYPDGRVYEMNEY